MGSILKIQRYIFDKDWTISKYFVNGKQLGFGVEDEVRTVKVHGETCIPAGTYELGFRQSPKFSSTFVYSESLNKLIQKKDWNGKGDYKPHDLMWIKNIPGFEFVLIHWGNTDDDTEGCYIVGDVVANIKGQKGVAQSRNNYMNLYPKLYPLVKKGGQTVTIENVK